MNLQEVSFIAPCTSSGADRSHSGTKKQGIVNKKIFVPIFCASKFLLPTTARRMIDVSSDPSNSVTLA